ncbi:hypothetical protein V2J09_022152 [Rumex salicifolius]
MILCILNRIKQNKPVPHSIPIAPLTATATTFHRYSLRIITPRGEPVHLVSLAISKTGRIPQLGMISSQAPRLCFSTVFIDKGEHVNERISDDAGPAPETTYERPIGWNITRKEKIKFLTKTLLSLDDSKDAVYGTLDSWVAWEQNFPIAALKNVLLTLEKEQQWHRVVQVTKWLLSKGQANTMGTYRQLIRALDMDHRAEEAHQFWVRKIGHDLHPVPWQLCSLMISIYYRNNMFDNLVKLFKGLEAFGRTPPEKSIVQKVVNAYEILGMASEKERVMQKYSNLLSQTRKEADHKKKSKKSKPIKIKSPGMKMNNTSTPASDDQRIAAE